VVLWAPDQYLVRPRRAIIITNFSDLSGLRLANATYLAAAEILASRRYSESSASIQCAISCSRITGLTYCPVDRASFHGREALAGTKTSVSGEQVLLWAPSALSGAIRIPLWLSPADFQRPIPGFALVKYTSPANTGGRFC
jgi:hypothetical protein